VLTYRCSQVDELSKGIVDLRRLVFDGTVIVFPLFVTTRVVDSWRWADGTTRALRWAECSR
jgi:hypothetical protein